MPNTAMHPGASPVGFALLAVRPCGAIEMAPEA